jgi:hypothetical protein
LSKVKRFLRCMTIALVVSAFAFTSALLMKEAGLGPLQGPTRSLITALPLLSVGLAFLTIQPTMRLRPKQFLKNALLAATFILWGIVQLMPESVVSMRLSSLVVALYVFDLGLVTLLSVNPTQELKLPGHAQRTAAPEKS